MVGRLLVYDVIDSVFRYSMALHLLVEQETRPLETSPKDPIAAITDNLSVSFCKSSDDGGVKDIQLCQISHVMRHGDPSTMMCSKACLNEAIFVPPMGAGDKLCHGTNNGYLKTAVQMSACAICADHLDTYQRHVAACACRATGRTSMGLPFPTTDGTVFECHRHTKERLLRGAPLEGSRNPTSVTHKRKVKNPPPPQGRRRYPNHATLGPCRGR